MAVSTEAYTEAFTEVLLRQQAEVAELEARLREARGGLAALPVAVPQAMPHPACRWPGFAQPPCPLAPAKAYTAPVPSTGGRLLGTGCSLGSLPLQPVPPACGQPLTWPRPMPADLKASPDNVLVERRRTFGDREFRLWVEDLAERGGIRIYAMDTVSFARLHTDVKDADIQLMFNQYWWKMNRKRSGDHGEQLTEFLGTLLDAAYLELEGGDLELRIPQFVEPPKPAPPSEDMNGGWLFFGGGRARDGLRNGGSSRPGSASRQGGARQGRRPPTASEASRPSRPQSASGRPQRPRPQSAREEVGWLRELAGRAPAAGAPSRPGSAGAGPTPLGLDATRRPLAQDADLLTGAPSQPPRPSSAIGPRRRAGEEVSERLHSAHTFASISRFPGHAMSGGG